MSERALDATGDRVEVTALGSATFLATGKGVEGNEISGTITGSSRGGPPRLKSRTVDSEELNNRLTP
jgi:hypothetical protein